MPIVGSELNKFRTQGTQYTKPVINYWPAETVATAVLTVTPDVYPIGAVTVSWISGMANVKPGQLYIIRSGNNIVTYGVVRLAPASNQFYLDGKSRGDSGKAVNQAFALAASQVLTVYTLQPIWSLISRISGGVFYKKFDVPYDNSGSNPSPVVNIGPWRQVWADTVTGRGSVSFSNSNSFAWLNKTLSSYSWTVPGTATYTSGTNTTANITLSLPQGFHLIRCRVTDSGGAYQDAVRPVWVNGSDFPPLSERYGFEIGGDSQNKQSRNVSYTFYGDLDEDDFLPGTAFHMTEDAYYAGQRLSSGVLTENFVGYIPEETRKNAIYNGEKSVAFDAKSPWSWFESIPMVSQAIVESNNPVAWTDIAQTLGTTDFIGWYILKHHTTYLDLFDYMPLRETSITSTVDSPRKLNWGINGNTMAEYLNHIASTFGGNVGCASDGSLYMRRDPNLEYTHYRDALDERMTLTVDETTGVMDIVEDISYPFNFFNSVGQLRVFALMYDGTQTTAFGAIAPGYTQMQAPGGQEEDSFIVKAPYTTIDSSNPAWRPGGQDAVNRIAGHLLAKENAAIKEISLQLNRNLDVFDPPKMVWFRLSIPATWNPRGSALNTRVIPSTVERTWEQTDGGGWVKNITVTVAPETFGQPGETYDLDKGGGDVYEPEIPPIDEPPLDEETMPSPFVVAINENGRVAITKNGENWSDIRGNMPERIRANDITFDVGSPYVLSGYTEGELGAWIAVALESSSGSDVFNTTAIYYSENILAQNVTWTRQFVRNMGNVIEGSIRIKSHPLTQGYVACASMGSDGMYVIVTEDGETWAYYNAGDVSVSGYSNKPVDLAFEGDVIVASGWKSSASKFRLGYFPSVGAPWSFAVSSPDSDVPFPMIECSPDSNYVYATRILRDVSALPGTATYRVNTSSTPTKSATGVMSSSYFRGSFAGTSPATPVSGVSQYCGTPDRSTCTGAGSSPCSSDDGWSLHTSVYNDPAAMPAKIEEAPTTYGSVSGVGSLGVYGQVEIRFRGKITPDYNNSELFGAVLVAPADYPGDFFTCSIISLHNPVLRIDYYDRYGELIQQQFEDGYNDADGWTGPDPLTCTYLTGDSVDEVAVVVLTYYHLGKLGALDYYAPILYGGATVGTLAMDIENPQTYRITDITGATPTYDIIIDAAADDKFPANPYSISIDSLQATALTSVFRIPGNYSISDIAASTNEGTDWTTIQTDLAYYGISQVQDYGIVWGVNVIQTTTDGFNTLNNIFGDWRVSIDSGGLFRVAKGIF